jgi:hypothetical protein
MRNATLPFTLGLEIPRAVTADLLIQIDVGSTDPAVARPYIELIEIFIRAVRNQVLPCLEDQDCSWDGPAPSFDPRQRLISATARVTGLAPEAYLVLVALLAQSASADDPPTYVRIASPGTPDTIGLQSLRWDRLQADDLPVQIEHTADGEPLEVSIECSSPSPSGITWCSWADIDSPSSPTMTSTWSSAKRHNQPGRRYGTSSTGSTALCSPWTGHCASAGTWSDTASL